MLYENDQMMKYDLKSHMYVLTEDGFLNGNGYALRGRLDTESADQDLTISFFLRRVSENAYAMLTCMASDVRSTHRFLALPENRERVYRLLCRLASDMMVQNQDSLEGSEKPAVSVGVQMLMEPLYGNCVDGSEKYGEDY